MSEKAWWTSVDDLAAVLEVTNPDTASKSVITRIAEGLRGEFVGADGCNRPILVQDSSATLTEFHNGGRQRLLPRVCPVSNVSNVWVDFTRVFADSTKLDAATWSLSDNTIWFLTPMDRLWNNPLLPVPLLPGQAFNSGFPSSRLQLKGIIKIEYVGGYTSLPKDIERVFHAELRKEWTLRKSPGIQSFGVSGASWTVQQKFGLMDETRRVLSQYRNDCLFI